MLKQKVLLASVSVLISFGFSFAADTVDTNFISNENCDVVEKDLSGSFNFYRHTDYLMGGLIGVATSTDAVKNEASFAPAQGSSADFSQTNLQKEGVDEAEIIKTDGNYVYYYNETKKKIFIVQGNDTNAKIISTIPLKQDFYNVQLFLNNGHLVVVGTQYTYNNQYYRGWFMNGSSKTIALVYDISSFENPKVLKAIEIDGDLREARITNNKLILVGFMGQAFYSDSVKPRIIDSLPTVTSIYRTNSQSLQNTKRDGEAVPYNTDTFKLACKDFLYRKVKSDKIVENNNGATVISTIDLNNFAARPVVKTLLGDVGQVHVSTNSIYVVSNIYRSYPWICPMNARCFAPDMIAGSYSMISKFNISNGLNYNYSSVVPGYILNQYSMDEDDSGNFRIITSNRGASNGAGVYVLDGQGSVIGKLENIQPGEQFKSSRYIGNKLYLVTFKQVDPLFVIDMVNPRQPKMIGELHIPGYSTYLHPYEAASGGEQYIVGLGYNTKTNQRGGTQNGGIKIDLIKVDYNSKETKDSRCARLLATNTGEYATCVSQRNGDNIMASLVTSTTLGDQGSYSESLDNPRAFVRDSNNKRLYLPALLTTATNQQTCSVTYDTDGKETGRNCYDNPKITNDFIGVKVFNFTKTSITQYFSRNFAADLKSKAGSMYDGMYSNIYNTRAGYVGNSAYFYNSKFAGYFNTINGNTKLVSFDKEIGLDRADKCATPQACTDGTCVQRWIYDKNLNSCSLMSASASLGFDTKFACTDVCSE